MLCEEEGQEGEMDSGEGPRRKELLEDVRKKNIIITLLVSTGIIP